jgi:hypothetical protein
MELRFYQTYDNRGVDSDTNLQFRETDEDEWEDVGFVRERHPDADLTPQYED